MKSIYLDVAGRMHSLYKELILYPPPGYQFVTQGTSWDELSNAIARLNWLYSFQERVLSRIIPVNFAKAYLERFKKLPEGTDLTYATGHLVFRKEPWVVDFELVTQLAGYSIRHFKRYRRLIEEMLASGYCRKIICWTEASRRTVLENLNCDGFEHKVEIVPLAVPARNFVKEYNDTGRIKLLFVGSANIPGEFELNGGKELLEAFANLSKRYDNLELLVRSDIPQEIKNRYRGINNLRIIEELLPWDQLEQEFKSADIFLFPAHTTPGLVMLDAMSYELPVIATDVWANPEMVEDGKTGLIIRKSEKVQYYTENFILIATYAPKSRFMKSIKNLAPGVVEDLVEKTTILIENEELRRRMGKAGRREIETGKFSTKKRNEKLRRIFDEATGV